MSIQVSELFYYPIKSFAGIACEQLCINAWGPLRDRRLMLVDEQGHFITQRQCRIMALMSLSDNQESLTLAYQGESFTLAWPDFSLAISTQMVQVWEEEISGQGIGGGVNAWLSRVLQSKVKLVYMADDTHRQVDLTYASQGIRTGFADGFPFLVVSQESIMSLQQELTFELDVKRFRPNIVVSGCEPFSEDQWKTISINNIEFNLVKPCSRCVIPSIDLTTGLMQKEVMQVMVAHRKRDGEVYLGQNAVHKGKGSIEVGQQVKIIV